MTNWIKKLTGSFSPAADNRLPFEKDRDLLFQAVRDNDLKKVGDLAAQYGNEIADWKTKEGSLLNVAQSKGHFEAFELLAAHGANVNEYDSEGRTPLLRALKKNQKELVDYLIDNGADLNVVCIGNHHYARQIASIGVFYGPERYSSLHFAVERGDRDTVVKLLERGARPATRGSRAGDCDAIDFAERKKKFSLSDLMKRADKIRADYLAKISQASPASPPAANGTAATDRKIEIMNPLHLKKSPNAPA